jgi:uncharacterized protein YodC (DUF2158 family)
MRTREKFRSGDVVQLKSGGPSMSVKCYVYLLGAEESDMIYCQWFDDKGELKGGEFHENSLAKVDAQHDGKSRE